MKNNRKSDKRAKKCGEKVVSRGNADNIKSSLLVVNMKEMSAALASHSMCVR